MSRLQLSRRSIVAATLAAPAILGRRARAAGTIQMISHRYPALEYYAEKMRTAIPGTTVNTQLMPIDKALELITIALSSKADTIDILYANESNFQTFEKNGWHRVGNMVNQAETSGGAFPLEVWRYEKSMRRERQADVRPADSESQ